eukprot:4396500-Pyramimonas_sp.AAC.1
MARSCGGATERPQLRGGRARVETRRARRCGEASGRRRGAVAFLSRVFHGRTPKCANLCGRA